MWNLAFWMLLSWLGTFPSATQGTVWDEWQDNPAVIGLRPGTEFGFSYFAAGDTGFALGYRYNFAAFTAKFQGDARSYMFGVGLPLGSAGFFRKIALGYGYIHPEGKNVVGLAAWPHRYLSLGAAVLFTTGGIDSGKFDYEAGAGVRPFTDKVTFWVGLSGEGEEAPNWGVAASGDPFSWLHLHLAYFPESKDLNMGVILSLGGVRFGMSGASDGGYTGTWSFTDMHHGTPLGRKKAVKVVLDGEYPESPAAGFPVQKKPSFYSLLRSLEAIRGRGDVGGVLLIIKNPKLTMAQVEELGAELAKLKKSGKKVAVFSKNYDLGRLWLASHADMAAIAYSGFIFMPGFMSGGLYFRRMFDSLGIDVNALHIREYKSAVEPFSRSSMSKADSAQRADYLSDIRDILLPVIARKAGLDEDSLFALIDERGMWSDSEAVAIGLVDTALHASKVGDWAKKVLGCGALVDIKKAVSMRNYDISWRVPTSRIALVYIDGGIVSGKSGNDILMGRTVGDESVVKTLKKLKDDRSVKAVVVRVNSPGGSALASEEIWFALDELREKKPVIVSMANVAASGGYYVSAPASYIFADSTTLTGSIGILAMKFTFRRLLEKVGVDVDYIKMGRHADAMSPIARPLTAEEESLGMEALRYGYEIFLKRVAEPRKMSIERVDSLGRGHIYSGIRALRLGLVDTLGGLMDAIDYAKKTAGVEDAEVKVYGTGSAGNILELISGAHLSARATKELLSEPYSYLYLPFLMIHWR